MMFSVLGARQALGRNNTSAQRKRLAPTVMMFPSGSSWVLGKSCPTQTGVDVSVTVEFPGSKRECPSAWKATRTTEVTKDPLERWSTRCSSQQPRATLRSAPRTSPRCQLGDQALPCPAQTGVKVSVIVDISMAAKFTKGQWQFSGTACLFTSCSGRYRPLHIHSRQRFTVLPQCSIPSDQPALRGGLQNIHMSWVEMV